MVNVNGICNFVARFFTMFSPMGAEMPKPFPLMLFSVTTLVGVFVADNIITKHKALEKDAGDLLAE